MEPADYVSYLAADGAALAAAARVTPEAPVPTCPDWDLIGLVGHIGAVHRWVDKILRTRSSDYVEGEAPPGGLDATLAWYDDGLASLLAAFGAIGPDEAVWNWADRGPGPARFWFRRMAHETAVHRWDAENAASTDRANPIAAELAMDGIDEYLSFVGLWLARRPMDGFEGTLHLHAIDTDGEWSLDLHPDGVDVSHEHTKADAAIRATVSDLFLWMVNRIEVDNPSLEPFGSPLILASWRQLEF